MLEEEWTASVCKSMSLDEEETREEVKAEESVEQGNFADPQEVALSLVNVLTVYATPSYPSISGSLSHV